VDHVDPLGLDAFVAIFRSAAQPFGHVGLGAKLWYFDESPRKGEAPNDWRVAGTGTVSADGRTIRTDPGMGIPKILTSNADSICDLAGPFQNISAGGGWGPNGTGEGFWGSGSRGVILGGGITIGAGVGSASSITVTNTSVVPLTGCKCK
jgi:hypothetical protein